MVCVLRFQTFAMATRHQSLHVRYIIVRCSGITLSTNAACRYVDAQYRRTRVRTLEVKIFRSRQSDTYREKLTERKNSVTELERRLDFPLADLTDTAIRPHVATSRHSASEIDIYFCSFGNGRICNKCGVIGEDCIFSFIIFHTVERIWSGKWRVGSLFRGAEQRDLFIDIKIKYVCLFFIIFVLYGCSLPCNFLVLSTQKEKRGEKNKTQYFDTHRVHSCENVLQNPTGEENRDSNLTNRRAQRTIHDSCFEFI